MLIMSYITLAKLFERKPMPATQTTFEVLSTLRPLEKNLQVLWLGSTLNVDVPIEVLTKDLVWGSTSHDYWLLFIPPEWFIDATLERNLKVQEELQWIVVEASSCLVTTPPPPYRSSDLPIDWWYPFLAWNGSTTVEKWLKNLKSRTISRSSMLNRKESVELLLQRSVNNTIPPNPIRIIKLYKSFLQLLSSCPRDLHCKKLFYRFLEKVIRTNPLLGHVLVKAHGFDEFLDDQEGTDVLEGVSSRRYKEMKEFTRMSF